MRVSLIIAMLMPLLVSCEKELDFHYKEVDSQLVVEGQTSETGTVVSLTYTCPMGEAMDVTPIVDADVIITDITAGIQRNLLINQEGVFMDNTPGIPDHDYRIEISHNGNYYYAESTMPEPIQILDLDFQWIKMPYDHVAVLRIAFTDLPSTDNCYWIKLYRNGESYKWILSDDRASVNGVISEVTMTTRKHPDDENDKDTLVDGDILDVVINPISHGMYDYLIAIQSDSNGPRMFQGDFCLGYYMATSNTFSSITFHPQDIPEYK